MGRARKKKGIMKTTSNCSFSSNVDLFHYVKKWSRICRSFNIPGTPSMWLSFRLSTNGLSTLIISEREWEKAGKRLHSRLFLGTIRFQTMRCQLRTQHEMRNNPIVVVKEWIGCKRNWTSVLVNVLLRKYSSKVICEICKYVKDENIVSVKVWMVTLVLANRIKWNIEW